MPFKHEDQAVRATPEWTTYRRACNECDSYIQSNLDGQGHVQPMPTRHKAAIDAAWNAVKTTKAWAGARGDG